MVHNIKYYSYTNNFNVKLIIPISEVIRLIIVNTLSVEVHRLVNISIHFFSTLNLPEILVGKVDINSKIIICILNKP